MLEHFVERKPLISEECMAASQISYYSNYKNDRTISHFLILFFVFLDETKYLAVTQHESTGARKSFPCLDEPDKKARCPLKSEKVQILKMPAK